MMLIDEEQEVEEVELLLLPLDLPSSQSLHTHIDTSTSTLYPTENPVSPTTSFAATDPFYATLYPNPNHIQFPPQNQHQHTHSTVSYIAPQSAFFQTHPIHAQANQ